MSTMRAPHLLHGQPCCACGADARELCGELALAARAAHVPWRNRTCTSANELPELHSSGPPPCFASRSVASWSMVNARVMDLTVYHHGGESRASLTPAPWQHGWLPCAVAGGRTANQCQHAVRPPTGPIENVCMHKDAAARVFFRISVCGLKYQVPYRTVPYRDSISHISVYSAVVAQFRLYLRS